MKINCGALEYLKWNNLHIINLYIDSRPFLFLLPIILIVFSILQLLLILICLIEIISVIIKLINYYY